MNDDAREFMSKIAMVLIENRMIFEQLAESLELLADKGLPVSSFMGAVDVLREQVVKIDSLLGAQQDK